MGASRDPNPPGILNMRVPGVVSLIAAAVTVTSCGSIAPMSPTSPTAVFAVPSAPPPGAPLAAAQSRPITGTVQPLTSYPAACWAGLYACEVFDFSTSREGPIEVNLAWDGAPRALRVQLYWVGGALAHEDIAPASGPSRISFMRPRMEAAAYRLRVVSLEPGTAIPFTLTITY